MFMCVCACWGLVLADWGTVCVCAGSAVSKGGSLQAVRIPGEGVGRRSRMGVRSSEAGGVSRKR